MLTMFLILAVLAAEARTDHPTAISQEDRPVVAIEEDQSPKDEPAVDETHQRFIGLDEQAALKLAAELKRPFRVVSRDGERLMVTKDFRPERINATVMKGVITAVTGG
jgi:hypothetical protein